MSFQDHHAIERRLPTFLRPPYVAQQREVRPLNLSRPEELALLSRIPRTTPIPPHLQQLQQPQLRVLDSSNREDRRFFLRLLQTNPNNSIRRYRGSRYRGPIPGVIVNI